MSAASEEILYARYEHGSYPIRVVPKPGVSSKGTFEILSKEGDVQAQYTSARNLITALTQNPGHHISFAQYFGRLKCPAPVGGSILDLFSVQPKPKKQALIVSPPTIGIDLAVRGGEVRKLLFAGFGSRIARAGFDPEEVLQEVYRGILARNRGICPFDARKSSFGHYVHLVISCILNNYHRRETRHRTIEQVGMTAPLALRDGAEINGGIVDAATIAEQMSSAQINPHSDGSMKSAVQKLTQHLERKSAQGAIIDPMAAQIATLLAEGLNRKEIAAVTGIPVIRISKSISTMREHLQDWL